MGLKASHQSQRNNSPPRIFSGEGAGVANLSRIQFSFTLGSHWRDLPNLALGSVFQSLPLTTAKVHLPKDFRADIGYSSLNKALEMVAKTDQSMPP